MLGVDLGVAFLRLEPRARDAGAPEGTPRQVVEGSDDDFWTLLRGERSREEDQRSQRAACRFEHGGRGCPSAAGGSRFRMPRFVP